MTQTSRTVTFDIQQETAIMSSIALELFEADTNKHKHGLELKTIADNLVNFLIPEFETLRQKSRTELDSESGLSEDTGLQYHAKLDQITNKWTAGFRLSAPPSSMDLDDISKVWDTGRAYANTIHVLSLLASIGQFTSSGGGPNCYPPGTKNC